MKLSHGMVLGLCVFLSLLTHTVCGSLNSFMAIIGDEDNRFNGKLKKTAGFNSDEEVQEVGGDTGKENEGEEEGEDLMPSAPDSQEEGMKCLDCSM